jgi:hypothetical protein
MLGRMSFKTRTQHSLTHLILTAWGDYETKTQEYSWSIYFAAIITVSLIEWFHDQFEFDFCTQILQLM